MLTNTGIITEFIQRGWHCPICLNRALDAIITNFKRGNITKALDVRDVRIFDEVSKSEYGRQATIFVHEMERHSGTVWALPETPYDAKT